MRRSLLFLPALALLISGCSASAVRDVVEATPDPVELSANVEADAVDVPVETLLEVSAVAGEVTEVELVSEDGEQVVEGSEDDEGGWQAEDRLEPGTTYTLTATGEGEGEAAQLEQTFTTQELSLDELTYPAAAPLEGETVGVGMPIVVTFDLPVEEKAAFEENMLVETDADTEVEGSWSWFSDNVAHYRPKEYWPAGIAVTVDLQVNSLPAGNGIYGQQDQTLTFDIGRKVVSTVDVNKHTLSLSVDDEVQRTIPVSTGRPGNESRVGTKVVMEKFDAVDMDAASTGISEDDADYYNLSDVQWAMRLTNSGEFMHAAPWSVASQGRENVSAGCVGMSTADAKWVYDQSKRGDVVEFVGSKRPLEDRNGWTDWNVDWDTWTQGSALSDS